MAERIHERVDISTTFGPEPNRPPPVKVAREDFSDQYSGVTFEANQ